MGKLCLTVTCAILLTVLFSSSSLGAEHSKEVENERRVRDAGVNTGRPERKSKQLQGRMKNGKNRRINIKMKSTHEGKRSNKKQNISGKKKGQFQRRKSKKKRKSKMKRKSKKSRKSLQTKKKGNIRAKQVQNGRSRQNKDFCSYEKANSLKLLYNQVYNFKKKLRSVQRQFKITKKKKEKKDIFQEAAAIVTNIVGGNLTEPNCSAKVSLSSIAATQGLILCGCSTKIATSCEEIPFNSTLSGTCNARMNTFEKKVEQCKEDDSCSCWTEAFDMKSDIIICNATIEANLFKNKKKTCLKTFGNCKTAQDSAVQYIATCPTQINTISTTTTTTTTTTITTTTTKSAGLRRNIVEKILARNLMRRSYGAWGWSKA